MDTVSEKLRVREQLERPWYVTLLRDEDAWPTSEYVAEAPELPGCVARAGTPAEALSTLEEAMEQWFLDALDQGLAIPEPLEWVREPRAR